MLNQDKRVEILQRIERGELKAEEGLELLRGLDAEAAGVGITAINAAPVSPEPPVPPELPSSPKVSGPGVSSYQKIVFQGATPTDRDNTVEPEPERKLASELDHWKRWWMLPFWVGVSILVIGAGLMFWGFSAAHFGWGFWLAWIPFLGGLALMIIGWQSQKSRWLHVRIRQKPGERPGMIVISLPLPLRLAAWLLRRFGPFIPDLRNRGIDELLVALEQSVSPEAPFYVNVDGEDGEHVEVFIG